MKKRTLTFSSKAELKKELAQAIYNLHQFSIDDIASAFDITRQGLSLRNRQLRKNDKKK